jgi:hypothetical protein
VSELVVAWPCLADGCGSTIAARNEFNRVRARMLDGPDDLQCRGLTALRGTAFERRYDVTALEKLLHIDIPVNLSNVKMVFSVGASAFEGDLPASIFHLQLIEDDIADWNAKSEVITVFHTNAGHVLHDTAYNADRNIATGNPYKNLIGDLQKRGVQIELWGRPRKPITGRTQICFLGLR